MDTNNSNYGENHKEDIQDYMQQQIKSINKMTEALEQANAQMLMVLNGKKTESVASVFKE